MPRPPPIVVPPNPKLVVDIDQPVDGATLSDPDNVRVRISGTCRVDGDPDENYAVAENIAVTLSVNEAGQLRPLQSVSAQSGAALWAQFDLNVSGTYWVVVDATASAMTPGRRLHRTAYSDFRVNIFALPTLTIEAPAAGAEVADSPGTVTVRGTCSGSEPLSITATIGGVRYVADRLGATSWQVENVSLRRLGNIAIAASIVDGFDRSVSATPRAIVVRDVTAPVVSIDVPLAGARVSHELLVSSGGVQDASSGPAKVEWSLDGTTFRPAALTPDRARWSVREKVLALGPVTLSVRATDNAGNAATGTRSFVLVENVAPADRTDVTSRMSYLADLLAYVAKQVKMVGHEVSPADLEALLFQRFEPIVSQSPREALAPVPELRLIIDVLATYARANISTVLLSVRRRYLDGIYGALLAAIGTSIAEVRTAFDAPASVREALAGRLGIPAHVPASGDTIARLRLSSASITAMPNEQRLSESTLNALFGYAALTTSPSPAPLPGGDGFKTVATGGGPTRVASTQASSKERFTTETCLITQWRAAKLLQDSISEDNATTRAPSSALVIDPDLVCEADLVPGDNPLRALLVARTAELTSELQAIQDAIMGTAQWPASTEEDLVAAFAQFITLSTDESIRKAALDARFVASPDELNQPAAVLRAALAWSRAGRSEPVIFLLMQIDARGIGRVADYVAASSTQRSSTLFDVTDVIGAHRTLTALYPRWKAEEGRLALSISPRYFLPPTDEPTAVPGVFGTGLDGHRRPARVGAAELHWNAIQPIPVTPAVVIAPETGWVPNDERSQWIQVPGAAPNETVVNEFRHTFSLRGFEPASARMQVRVAVAPRLESSTINFDVQLVPVDQASSTRMFAFNLDDELGPDQNTLSFSLNNFKLGGGSVAAALRVEVSLTAVRTARAAITSRGSVSRRLAWEAKLLARAAQLRSLPETMAAACSIADVRVLPVLRDDLVRTAGAGLEEPADGLSRRLLIDVKGSSTRMTSRAEYAGRTLQTLLYALGSGTALDPALGALEVVNRTELAVDLAMLQSYDAWRAASLAFWFPENYLFPSILPNASFQTWLRTFITTGEDNRPAGMTDVARSFGVPVQIALQQLSQGEHEEALRTLQSVYDYRATSPKKWQGLIAEEQITSMFSREPRWFSAKLNPHDLAPDRRNAYTRFLLMTIARVMLELGDTVQVEGNDTAAERASFLYRDAQRLLSMIPPPVAPDATTFVPDNPLLRSLRARTAASIERLQTGLDIGGLSQTNPENLDGGVVEVGADGSLRIVTALAPPPTPYRYATLIDRAKSLTNTAQQVESLYLASLKDKDAEAYTLMRAQQEAHVTSLQTVVATARKEEAEASYKAVVARGSRLQITSDHYRDLIDQGIWSAEQTQLDELRASADLQFAAEGLSIASSVVSFAAAANPWESIKTFGASNLNAAASGLSSVASAISSSAGAKSTLASVEGLTASYDRRRSDWVLQQQLADSDLEANRADVTVAARHTAVAVAEGDVAAAQNANAVATVTFLGTTKFTNVALYDFMSRVLADVYRSVLGLATASARLAERQLAFERQEPVSGLVRSSYWNTRDTGDEGNYNGLTGSARLLKDITALDQRAFDTNRRKLQLRKTISLARLLPTEFRRFRETGVLPFATPMDLFDRDFPGHYLRLVNSVRISIAALVPPTEGIRGALYCPGSSRVVVQNSGFRALMQRRLPETVAFTSPINATGLFDVDLQPEMLRPFEGLGVDTTWVLELPRASNPFDFSTLIDVLMTIEYTALHDVGYRREIIGRIGRSTQGERSFSLRSRFPDVWYALQNTEDGAAITVMIDVSEADFPPNCDAVSMDALTVFIVPSALDQGSVPELEFSSLTMTGPDGTRVLDGARTFGGIVGTRRGNGAAWKPLEGRSPVGNWQLRLPNTSTTLAALARLQDIVIAISYRATLPSWPE